MIETTLFEEIVAAVWKPLLILIALMISAFYFHHVGYIAGEAEVQTSWNTDKARTAVVTNAQQVRATTINEESLKGLTSENAKLKDDLSTAKDYYEHHPVLLPRRVRSPASIHTSSNSVPDVPSAPGQPEKPNTDGIPSAGFVSKEDYNQLADDCLATTTQLDNAKVWANNQAEIFHTK